MPEFARSQSWPFVGSVNRVPTFSADQVRQIATLCPAIKTTARAYVRDHFGKRRA